MQDYSTNEVFSLFFEQGERRGSVAVLYRTWFDDTHDEKHEKYAVATGILGRPKTWTDFSKAWKQALREYPKIDYFHVKELRKLDGQFLQFRDPVKWPKPTGSQAASAKREKLKAVIENAKPIAAISVAVLVQDFNLVRNADSQAAELFRQDPYEVALQCFFYEVAKIVRRISQEEGRGDYGHCVGFVSDTDERSPIHAAVYADFKKNNPEIAKVMHGLAHLDDEKWAPLQAADMLSNFANHRFNDLLKIPDDERRVLAELPEFKNTFYMIANADKWYLCNVLKDLAGVSLFEKLGIPERRYMSEKEMEQEQDKGNRTFRPISGL